MTDRKKGGAKMPEQVNGRAVEQGSREEKEKRLRAYCAAGAGGVNAQSAC